MQAGHTRHLPVSLIDGILSGECNPFLCRCTLSIKHEFFSNSRRTVRFYNGAFAGRVVQWTSTRMRNTMSCNYRWWFSFGF